MRVFKKKIDLFSFLIGDYCFHLGLGFFVVGPTEHPDGFCSAAVRVVNLVTHEIRLPCSAGIARIVIQSGVEIWNKSWMWGTKSVWSSHLCQNTARTCSWTRRGNSCSPRVPGLLCFSEGIHILLFDVNKRCVLKILRNSFVMLDKTWWDMKT